MCKYCGGRISAGINRWGKYADDGAYCSRACANAVHGFDNQIESERRNKTESFNGAKHDLACPNTRQPWEEVAEKEEGEASAPPPAKYPMTAPELLALARKIDHRLPDILMGIAAGETVESIGKRWGKSHAWVCMLTKRMRAIATKANT